MSYRPFDSSTLIDGDTLVKKGAELIAAQAQPSNQGALEEVFAAAVTSQTDVTDSAWTSIPGLAVVIPVMRGINAVEPDVNR